MGFVENTVTILENMGSVLSSFGWQDVFDIALVAIIIFGAIKLIRETRAFQLAKGLILVGLIYFIVNFFGMQATKFLFSKLMSDVLILLIVLFHPEIRHAIEHVGRGRWFSAFLHQSADELSESRKSIIEISKACQRMSNSKTGSIIIMERKTKLGDIIDTGIKTDSVISHELIGNIFFPNSPLHDGAAIVRDSKLYAAGCVLPLTQNSDIPSDLGMRHRAAIGVTEQSDAIAIITSEETGIISICCKGEIERGFDESSLRSKLLEYFEVDKAENQNLKGVSRVKNLFRGNKK